jgi:hypothetical protein
MACWLCWGARVGSSLSVGEHGEGQESGRRDTGVRKYGSCSELSLLLHDLLQIAALGKSGFLYL